MGKIRNVTRQVVKSWSDLSATLQSGGLRCAKRVFNKIKLVLRTTNPLYGSKSGKIMRRTQIYLQDTLYEQLKHKSKLIGASISELIRRAVEKDLNKPSSNEARAFFNALSPLQSYAITEPEQYVNDIRSRSRILINIEE
jgi:hypothetical protein